MEGLFGFFVALVLLVGIGVVHKLACCACTACRNRCIARVCAMHHLDKRTAEKVARVQIISLFFH